MSTISTVSDGSMDEISLIMDDAAADGLIADYFFEGLAFF